MKSNFKTAILLTLAVLVVWGITITGEVYSQENSAYENCLTPSKPEELNAHALYYGLIRLDWKDNSNNEDGFQIYKRHNQRDRYELLFTVTSNKTSAYVWDLEALTEYRFYIRAFNMYGPSDKSNIAVETTPEYYVQGTPEPPTDLFLLNQSPKEVTIQWQDNSNNEWGFKIARKEMGDPYYEIIDSVESDVLTYREVGLEPDRIFIYKVCAYNEYGFSAYTNEIVVNTGNEVIDNINLISKDFKLADNYPNPFNPVTKIEFAIPEVSFTKLSIYNTLGEEMDVLVNSQLQAGQYSYQWDASRYNSGVYFYRLESGNFTETKRMILIK